MAEYAQVAAKYGLTPAQLALAFVRDRWFVASNIIGGCWRCTNDLLVICFRNDTSAKYRCRVQVRRVWSN